MKRIAAVLLVLTALALVLYASRFAVNAGEKPAPDIPKATSTSTAKPPVKEVARPSENDEKPEIDQWKNIRVYVRSGRVEVDGQGPSFDAIAGGR